MRRFALLGSFVALVAAIFYLWQQRFERSPQFPTYRLADLKAMTAPVAGVEWLNTGCNPRIRLSADKAGTPVCVRMEFPGILPVDALQVRVRMESHGLKAGQEAWDDGRCIIEWHPVGGGSSENDAVASVRGDDPGEVTNFVMRPKLSPAVPVLRLEFLGRAGEFELTLFEATVVRETWVWKIGCWVILAAWLAWSYGFVVHIGGKGWLRSLLGASLWLLMGIYFVVPGPWGNLRPLAAPFQVGQEVAKPLSPGKEPNPQLTGLATDAIALKSVGEIPIKGDLLLRIKFIFFKLRPLLHILLLLGPALVIALLVGSRSALWLTAIFAAATEVAEVAFGYGFDLDDVYDLVSDAIGIGLGLWLSHGLISWTILRRSNGRLTTK